MDAPYSKSLGSVKTDSWLLTHAEWNNGLYHSSAGSNETGVRKIVNGEILNDSFELIQHGWHNYTKAGEIILRLLEKGWDAYRISKLMWFINDKGWNRLKPTIVKLPEPPSPREE